jgi:hypothetical protein
MKFLFHSLIYFLPLFCNCQFRSLDSIQFLSSQAHIPAGWRLETRPTQLNSSLKAFCTDHAENTASILKQVCLLISRLAIDVLLLFEFACAVICLPSRCLATDIYHSTITAKHDTVRSWRHVYRLILVSSFFGPWGGEDMFLRNVGLPPKRQGVFAQKNILFMITIVRTQNGALFILMYLFNL